MNIQELFVRLKQSLPGVLWAVVLLAIALLLALILKKLSIRGLNKINFDEKLQKTGMSRNSQESATFTETIGTLIYFITILVFVPFILSGLNVSGVVTPFIQMAERFYLFIPNLIVSILIIVIGSYFANFIKSLLQNLFEGINVDRWYRKAIGKIDSEVIPGTRLAEVLASIVYVLILIPMITVALEILGIKSISDPIIQILNQIMAAVPNILTAAVLIMIGSFIAKLVSDLIESMLSTSGIDKYSIYLNFKGEDSLRISAVTAQLVRMVFMLFFIVEALTILQLDVLNAMGRSVIAYLPSMISSVIIMGVGIIGSNIMAHFMTKVSSSKLFGEFIRYAILVFVVFMTLEQLQFAQSIVSISFGIILGAIAFAFALAFGLGGRDFAAKQLEKASEAIDGEGETLIQGEAKDLDLRP
ncbi:TPA: mechanosensitive ion channel [Streptococcus suis]